MTPAETGRSDRPTTVATFLFSDVVGSTRLWAADPDAMSDSLRIHDRLVRKAVESRSGFVFTTAGDSFAVAFARPEEAVAAAVDIQGRLASAGWGGGPVLSVRIGIHRGPAEERDGDFFGPTVNTTARLEAAGHGGQILVSDVVVEAGGVEAAGADAVDLGHHRLRDIDAPVRIYQVGRGPFPPLRGVGTVRLPVARTSLIGREAAVVELRRLLAEHPLVTLTGVGGCGKTRLALEVAHEEAPDCPGGVWFVDLAAISDPDEVPGAFAAALGITTDPFTAVSDQIVTYLASRAGLLVVDNCEHVVDAAAEVLDVTVAGCREMRVLATSREQLAVEGEVPWRVPSLGLGPASASVELFVDRATTAAAGFRLDDDVRAVVAEICERLDGIPLAIELAAARTRSMGVGEIRARLEDRFRLLSGGRRRGRSRQATLESAVQWSFDLLDPAERSLLVRLGVFHGGFDVADVPTVTGVGADAAVDLVDSLVAKSLVDVRREAGDVVRHRLLETIRLFALDRLVDAGEAESVRDRHREHFLGLPAVADWGAWQRRGSYDRACRELENLRAAAAWAVERGRPTEAARIAATVHDVLFERGEAQTGLAWLGLGNDLVGADRVRVLGATAFLHINSFDLDGGEAACRAALGSAGEEPVDTLPWVHLLLGQVAMMRGDVAGAEAEIGRAVAIAPTTPNASLNLSNALLYRCLFAGMAGDFTAAVADADTVLAATPDYTYRSLVEALRTVAVVLAGDATAADGLPAASEADGTAAWAHAGVVAAACVEAKTAGAEEATRRLATQAAESVPRRPMTIGDWLAGFAYLAAERGETDRAAEIIAVTVAPVLVALEIEVLARVHRWSGPRFDHYREYLRDNPADERVGRAIVHQPVVLAAELARWS